MKFKPQATIILAVGWSIASLVQVAWYVLLSQSMGWRQTCNRPNHDETMRLTDCSHLNHSAKNHIFYCLNCYSRHPIIHQSKNQLLTTSQLIILAPTIPSNLPSIHQVAIQPPSWSAPLTPWPHCRHRCSQHHPSVAPGNAEAAKIPGSRCLGEDLLLINGLESMDTVAFGWKPWCCGDGFDGFGIINVFRGNSRFSHQECRGSVVA
jgi:hypothetical protein